jgi:hypothetical protein
VSNVDTFRDAASLAKSLADVGKAIERCGDVMGRDGGKAARSVFEPAVRASVGGDSMLGTAVVGVASVKLADGWIVRAKGPVHLADNPTRAHTITPRSGRVLMVGDRFVTGPVQHPGTRGKGRWRAAEPAAVDAATEAMVAAFDKAVK